jgi:hypothetical protein
MKAVVWRGERTIGADLRKKEEKRSGNKKNIAHL